MISDAATEMQTFNAVVDYDHETANFEEEFGDD
jgi:hypothetical protein